MTFAAIKGVAAAMRGAGNKAVGARLAAGVKEGVAASKQGVQLIPLMADDAASGRKLAALKQNEKMISRSQQQFRDYADRVKNSGDSPESIEIQLKSMGAFPQSPPSVFSTGDLGQNLVARFANAATSPPVRENILGTGIGVALGQNPFAALGSNVAGNVAGRYAGGLARKALGDDSLIAGGVEFLTNAGVSYLGGDAITGMLNGGNSATEQETLMRTQQQQMMGQRQMPANGTMRQMADLQGAAGAMQMQGRPETPQFADQRMGGMVEIPMLDAATADKLRKRAMENAQLNQFTATQLGGYMEGM